MTIEEILHLFLKGAGNTPEAGIEKWIHLNESQRLLCGLLDLPQLHARTTLSTVANQDYVTIDDTAVYNVDWVVQRSTGRKLDPEPGGQRGRSRFFEVGQNRPPINANLTYWASMGVAGGGTRVYLRDTPDAIYTLDISYRQHPPTWSDATSKSGSPILPLQYHMALVRGAIGSYLQLHPPPLPEGGVDYSRGASMMEAVQAEITTPRNVVAEEQKDRRDYLQQAGYSFNIR